MKPFKVGDLVTDVRSGKGVVKSVNAHYTYPIIVDFTDNVESFTIKGKYTEQHAHPTLIHGHFDTLRITGVKPKKEPNKTV